MGGNQFSRPLGLAKWPSKEAERIREPISPALFSSSLVTDGCIPAPGPFAALRFCCLLALHIYSLFPPALRNVRWDGSSARSFRTKEQEVVLGAAHSRQPRPVRAAPPARSSPSALLSVRRSPFPHSTSVYGWREGTRRRSHTTLPGLAPRACATGPPQPVPQWWAGGSAIRLRPTCQQARQGEARRSRSRTRGWRRP